MARVIVEHFDNLSSYLDIIGKRKPNKVFQGKPLHSEENGYGFNLTHSYEEAVQLAQNGYREGLKGMMTTGERIRHRASAPKAMPQIDVVGYAPHVPNAITGVPKSMISQVHVEQKAKVVTLLYYMGGTAGVDARRFLAAGKNILDVINTLETQGYRVGLNVMLTFCASEWAFNTVQIKHWRQPSNPLKMSYPLIHPSYFRRNGFRWLETTPELTDDDFTWGYGTPFLSKISGSADKRREWLTKHGILKSGWFYTDSEEAENNKAPDLIKKMGIDTAGESSPSATPPPKAQ